MEHLHEEEGPALHKAAEARTAKVPGRIHALMGEYDKLNHRDRENMERLSQLLTKIEGSTPEPANDNPERMREPDGLLDGIEKLNGTHAHNGEIISIMISKLEELI